MPDRSYWLRVLKHDTFLFALILLLPGVLLWWLSIKPLAPLETFEQMNGTITQIMFPSEHNRMEISIQTEQGVQHLYVLHLYWLEQRSKALRTLEKDQQIQVRYSEDLFSRDFVEVREITRGDEVIVSYDDIQWAEYESDAGTKMIGLILMAYAGLCVLVLPVLLVKQFMSDDDFSASEHLTYDSVGALLASSNILFVSIGSMFIFISDPDLFSRLWWFLILTLYFLYRGINEFYKACWKSPHLIVLKNSQITFSFIFRGDKSYSYHDVESMQIFRTKSFWKSQRVYLQVSQSRLDCQWDIKDIPNFDLLPERLREKNPLCRIEEE